MARRYTLRRRAEQQEETRQRIIAAAVDLHRAVGPASTTFSAIAQRAGVQRHTLYRHFPDQEAILEACRGHFLAMNPPPDPTRWREITDPAERLRHGLKELYAYYSNQQEMIWNVLRDSDQVPAGSGFTNLQTRASLILLEAWPRPRQRLRALLTVAVDFFAWRSLLGSGGMSPKQLSDVIVAAAACLGATG